MANYHKTRINIGHQHDCWMELEEAFKLMLPSNSRTVDCRPPKLSRVICSIIIKCNCFLNKVILFTFSSKLNYFFFRYACEAHGRIILEKQYSHMPVSFVLQATVKVSQNCMLRQSNIPHLPPQCNDFLYTVKHSSSTTSV